MRWILLMLTTLTLVSGLHDAHALMLTGLDPDSQTLVAAMETTPDATRQELISETIVALKDAGIWDELDTLWVMAAHDEQASRLNWKNPAEFALTLINSPTFEADRGYQSDGVSSYLDTNFVPGTNGVNYTLNNASFGAYSRTNNNLIGAMIGAGEYPDSAARTYVRFSTGEVFFRVHHGSGEMPTFPNHNTVGLYAARRTASNATYFLKNGISTGAPHSGSSTVLPPRSFSLGATNSGSGVRHLSNHQLAFAFTGSAMTEQQHAEFYDIMQNGYLRAVGAAVYFTDFSEYDTGVPPDGWSMPGGTFDVLEGTYTGGKALRHRGLNPTPNYSYWSEIGQFGDVEILCKLRPVAAGINRRHIGVLVGDMLFHFDRLDGEDERVLLRQESVGSSTLLFSWSQQWHYMRMARIGTTAHGKVWRADHEEPYDWQISRTIEDGSLSVGVNINQNNNSDAFWDTFEVRYPTTSTPTNTPTSTFTNTPTPTITPTITPTFTPTNTPTNTPTEKPQGEPASVSRWREYD